MCNLSDYLSTKVIDLDWASLIGSLVKNCNGDKGEKTPNCELSIFTISVRVFLGEEGCKKDRVKRGM